MYKNFLRKLKTISFLLFTINIFCELNKYDTEKIFQVRNLIYFFH